MEGATIRRVAFEYDVFVPEKGTAARMELEGLIRQSIGDGPDLEIVTGSDDAIAVWIAHASYQGNAETEPLAKFVDNYDVDVREPGGR